MDELERLLRRTRAGDRRAYDALGKQLTALLQAFFSSRFDAELAVELTQRTLLDLLEKLPQAPLDGPAFTGMIYSFAWIEIRRWAARREQERKRVLRHVEQSEVLVPRRHLDELFAEVELWELTEPLLEELPATHRDVLIARLSGYSYKAIAAAFDIKAEAALARVRVAKQRITRWRERDRLTKTTFRTTKDAS